LEFGGGWAGHDVKMKKRTGVVPDYQARGW